MANRTHASNKLQDVVKSDAQDADKKPNQSRHPGFAARVEGNERVNPLHWDHLSNPLKRRLESGTKVLSGSLDILPVSTTGDTQETSHSLDLETHTGPKKNIRRIKQPPYTREYIVTPHDSLASIALQHDTYPSEIKELNKLNSQMLFPGQILFVPIRKDSEKSEDSPRNSSSSFDQRGSHPDDASDKIVQEVISSVRHSSIVDNDDDNESTSTRRSVLKSQSEEEEEISDIFLKINVKRITEKLGTVKGVLLVTPQSIMFNPYVSDPLVMEHGSNSYEVVVPLGRVTSAAMHHDLTIMKKYCGRKQRSSKSDPEAPIYRSKESHPLFGSKCDPPLSNLDIRQRLAGHGLGESVSSEVSASSETGSLFGVALNKDGSDYSSVSYVPNPNTSSKRTKSATTPTEVQDSVHSSGRSYSSDDKDPIAKQILCSSRDSVSSPVCDEGKQSENIKESKNVHKDSSSASDDDRVEQSIQKNKADIVDINEKDKCDHVADRSSQLASEENVQDENMKLQEESEQSSSKAVQMNANKDAVEHGEKEGAPSKDFTSAWSEGVDRDDNVFQEEEDKMNAKLASRATEEEAYHQPDMPFYLCLHVEHVPKAKARIAESQQAALASTATSLTESHTKSIQQGVLNPKTPFETDKDKEEQRGSFFVHDEERSKLPYRKEFWFAVPASRVDHLYSFFIRWSPNIYGREEDFEVLDESVVVAVRHRASLISKSIDAKELNILDAIQDFKIPLPELIGGASELISEDDISYLTDNIPSRCVGYNWYMIYSTFQHGISLKTLYRNMAEWDTPVLLIIKDYDNHVFGAMLSSEIRLSEGYYGTGESFMFTIKPEKKLYRWTGHNHYIIKGDVDGFAVGGGDGHFGIWIDENLYHGNCHPCKTFDNVVLSGKEQFLCQGLEAWGFA